jgi:ribosomal protein L11 methyltransferase
LLLGLHVAADEAELAADLLWQAGATAVEERRAARGVILVADVAPDAVGGRWRAEAVEVPDDSWRDEWRAWARPVRAGRRLVVRPPWRPFAAAPGDVVVDIDPGRAFGSGSHPSTRLALAALEDLGPTGRTVLDAGCGSGVLAVAAAVMGAARVTAVDVDLDAVDATVANARRNGVADRVDALSTPVHEVPGAFDLVVANLELPVLLDVASALAGRVARGGTLVVSGFLSEHVARVTDALGGLRVADTRTEDGWAAVSCRG